MASDSTPELDRLAAQLRRPVSALADFATLPPDELAALADAIARACEQERREVHAAVATALPGWLRALVLWGTQNPADPARASRSAPVRRAPTP